MAKILVSTLPVRGHVVPAAAAAQRLIGQGHDLLFALPKPALSLVPEGIARRDTTSDVFVYRPTSVRLSAMLAIQDIKAIADNLRYVLWAWTGTQLSALRQVAEEYSPDLVISDCLHLAPLIVARERGIPSIALGVTPYRNVLSGAAPVRSGWAPAANPMTRVLFDLINRGIELIFAGVREEVTQGLKALSPQMLEFNDGHKVSVFSICEELATRYVQCSSPSLEDRPDVLCKRRITFVGALNARTSAPMSGHSRSGHIVVTWGTMQSRPPEVFLEVVRRLSRTTGRPIYVGVHESQREHVGWPLRVEVALRRVVLVDNYLDVIDGAAVLVSNGGFGAVKEAISRGIPVACFGDQDDKPDVCGRIDRSGAGLGASWFLCPRRMVRFIVRVLEEPSFAERAEAVRLELAALDSQGKLEQVVESLLGEGRT